jgi:nuclear transport factor 2 (NTF2) superfamily protein
MYSINPIVGNTSRLFQRLSKSTSIAAMSSTGNETKPPLPPFTRETAIKKIRMAEDGWNSKNPDKIKMAYTEDTVWRNRSSFIKGRDEVREFLSGKWERELDYRLIKELWAFTDNRIAVRYCYEFHNDAGEWFRAYGNENWEFDENGLMRERHAAINDVPIDQKDRKFHWPEGARPEDHPGLSELGL